ncbi:Transcription factor [Penicillium argentinense]|uniref:Transcription factor n=1 Tax=Penicillium argentinense TaxID=1131581 RepID=A0A9W9EQK2_9EURO|nr:Transcription factor [Penicillium argentinense]KAJ5086193.1 Transcription factor [Penicillium argentinense]
MTIDAQPSLLIENFLVSMKKRLWWSILLRDRSLCIGLRRRPQITSVNLHGCRDWLKEEDFEGEMHASQIFNYEAKRRLLVAFQEQCHLAILLTDLVSVVFAPRATCGLPPSAEVFHSLMHEVEAIKRALVEWEAQALPAPAPTFQPQNDDPSAALRSLTFMYYHAARVDLAQYAALLMEEHLTFATQMYRNSVLQIGNDLYSGIVGLTAVMEYFSLNGHIEFLPLSVLAYVAMPLVLAAIDLKLSSSHDEMATRQRRLNSLSKIIRHSESLYDVTDFVAAGTNQILQLAYITTQDFFLPSVFSPQRREGSKRTWAGINHQGQLAEAGSCTRAKSWLEAFIRFPRAYLLISTSVDYSLAVGRLPCDGSLPEFVRKSPLTDNLIRLPWTMGDGLDKKPFHMSSLAHDPRAPCARSGSVESGATVQTINSSDPTEQGEFSSERHSKADRSEEVDVIHRINPCKPKHNINLDFLDFNESATRSHGNTLPFESSTLNMVSIPIDYLDGRNTDAREFESMEFGDGMPSLNAMDGLDTPLSRVLRTNPPQRAEVLAWGPEISPTADASPSHFSRPHRSYENLAMVGVPRSKGCTTCLQRRVKCDEKRPTCKRCDTRGLKCPGYERPPKFCHFAASRGHLQNRTRLIPAIATHPGGTESDIIDRERSTSFDECVAPSLVRSALCIQQKETFGRFVDANFPGLYYSWSTRVDINFMDFVRQQNDTFANALLLATQTLVMLDVGQRHRDSEKVILSRTMYIRSLQCLVRLIQNPRTVKLDYTLGTAILLAIYEMLDGSFQQSWLMHSRGIATLFQHRGPEVHRDGMGRTLLISFRSFLLADALVRGEPCFLAAPAWRSTITEAMKAEGEAGKGSQLGDLVECAFHEVTVCPGLVATARDMVSRSAGDDLGQRANLASAIATHRANLSKLYDRLLVLFAAGNSLEHRPDVTGPIPQAVVNRLTHFSMQGIEIGIMLLDQLLGILRADQTDKTPIGDSPKGSFGQDNLITDRSSRGGVTEAPDHVALSMGMLVLK